MMAVEDLISDEICQSLVALKDETQCGTAQRVALATLAGACRAICELNRTALDDVHIRQLVLGQLRDASSECRTIFSLNH